MIRQFTRSLSKGNWTQIPIRNLNGNLNLAYGRYFGSAFDHMDELEVETNIDANLSVTDACLETKLVPKNKFLRLSVKGGEGCDGFTYEFTPEENSTEEDIFLEHEDAKIVVVDRESLVLLQGSVIDYEETMAREGYIIQENPNAEQTCSCKMSFNPSDKAFGSFF